MNTPKSVLFVCLGNICRSPMAEGVFRSAIKEAGLKIKVDSAGTAGYHAGEPPDSRAVLKMKEKGIDISDLRARKFDPEDFQKFDRIYAMDSSNYDNILKLAKNDAERNKVKLFLNELYPEEGRSVPDPYYGGEEGFELVYTFLNDTVEKIISPFK